MTIRARLLGALCCLFLCVALSAGVGFASSLIALGGLRSIHDDRVTALRDLKVVSDMYAVNIVDASHKVRNGNIDGRRGCGRWRTRAA
jgi:methyl-accepting chemotaxis protein